MSAYEMPTETGQQRLQRERDRQHLWTQRGIVAAAVAGGALWLWREGVFAEGWNALWIIGGLVLLYVIVEAAFAPVEAALGWIFGGVVNPLSSRGYSYLDDETRDAAPDYSMAEVIAEEEDPKPWPEEEGRR